MAVFTTQVSHAQEALLSEVEQYYDSLSLQGLTQRPYLNFRTLSDSTWNIGREFEHPWQKNNLGTRRKAADNVFMRIYGPELFTSFNTKAPYGQNDGSLWQGRGFNSSITGGIRFETRGLELTYKPQLTFSQNLPFVILPSNYDSEYGYIWGYAHNVGVDAPQRFGDKHFFTYDWGDSEVRYTWKTFTAGFGNQAVWLGPAYLNPILHSNNAPSYPKFDIGMRKQPVTIPGIGWYAGDMEFRLWTGRLNESDYFDNDNSNNHTMFNGLAFGYAPSFSPGLTFFFNRVCLVPWKTENFKYIFPQYDNTVEDQKMSFGISYLLPEAGFEVYGELGSDDFVSGSIFDGYTRYLLHTLAYTVGAKKIVKTSSGEAYGELIFEWNNMEMSQDFQFQWPYSFYFHHQIIHGYTNKGQLIANGIGVGGNSQFLGFKRYYPKGSASVFVQRNNPDNNFLYSKAVEASATKDDLNNKYVQNWKANFIAGVDSLFFPVSNLIIGGEITYNYIMNPFYYYYKDDPWKDEKQHNFSLRFSVKYQF